MKKNLKKVAIIGRTNVGKSTLFNKFIEQQKALISTVAGTTRDLNFGVCEWQGREFEVVDTGGIFETKTGKDNLETIEGQTEQKAREIIEKADLLVLMVDIKSGATQKDRHIATMIKKTKKPYILVVNKCDTSDHFERSSEFKKLGMENLIPIAATSGKGVGDLLDEVVKMLKLRKRTKLEVKQEYINVSIVGRPNVGKSSLLNKVIKEDRVIVSPIPHTTREPQDTELEYQKRKIKLIDTAGIRRKSKIKANTLESAGIQMSIKTLKKSDIALFVLDISEGLTAQDSQLAGLIIQSGVSLVFVANKYDLIDKEDDSTKELTEYIYRSFPFLTWAPVIFTSATSGRNVHKILKLIVDINDKRRQKLDKVELNDLMHGLMKKMPPPRQPRKMGSPNKTRAFISKVRQKDNNPPVIEINVTNMAKIPESYMNYLTNNVREKFHYDGTPIKLVVNRLA